LLLFSAESFVFQFAIQKSKAQDTAEPQSIVFQGDGETKR